MLLKKHPHVASARTLLSEDVTSRLLSRRIDTLPKLVSECPHTCFEVTFEDEENIYDSKLDGVFNLAGASLGKGNIIAVLEEDCYRIIAPFSHVEALSRLTDTLGSIATIAVVLSEESDSHMQLSGFAKGEPFIAADQFLDATDSCMWSVESPDTMLHCAPPRSLCELLLYSQADQPLVSLTATADMSDEWSIKQRLSEMADYFIVVGRNASIGA